MTRITLCKHIAPVLQVILVQVIQPRYYYSKCIFHWKTLFDPNILTTDKYSEKSIEYLLTMPPISEWDIQLNLEVYLSFLSSNFEAGLKLFHATRHWPKTAECKTRAIIIGNLSNWYTYSIQLEHIMKEEGLEKILL